MQSCVKIAQSVIMRKKIEVSYLNTMFLNVKQDNVNIYENYHVIKNKSCHCLRRMERICVFVKKRQLSLVYNCARAGRF